MISHKNHNSCWIISFWWFPGVWIICPDISEHSVTSEHCVPKGRHIKFRCRGITQKERIQHSQQEESWKSKIIIILARKYLLNYLLTPWCRVLLEKLTGLQLVKKFPAFHGTRKFITALTRVRHLYLFWVSPIQYINPHPTFWRSILILSTHLRLGLPSGLLPSGFTSKTLYTPLFWPIRAT